MIELANVVSQSAPARLQFRIVHLLVLMVAAAVWLMVYRLGGTTQLFLVLGSSFALGPGLYFLGNRSGLAWLELLGVALTYAGPLLAGGAIALSSMLQVR